MTDQLAPEEVAEEGFRGEKLVRELVKRGIAKTEDQARFMAAFVEDDSGGCEPIHRPAREAPGGPT